jgi:hypothetical protein
LFIPFHKILLYQTIHLFLCRLAVCTQNYPPGNGIFTLNGNNATEISSNIIEGNGQIAELFGVWFIPNRHYYVVGTGIYEKRSLSDIAWEDSWLP